MAKNDGGPAFPTASATASDDERTVVFSGTDLGMSLRDWFAGQALTGMGTWMPKYRPDGSSVNAALSLCNPEMQSARAEWAYAQADAMLATREKSND